ncbi:5-carboxymethyl-2-hydroxymuconate Delta-isomerase [Virgibacillus salexigens]|uniref:5-carboxymethyl-2-hydroxymuconate isomerase n=1 Tax=Virgibacillus kapii TaxID=1638645 RepID=A0ABQ2DWE8_9BACI|nr:5-carboxymethyl-2-hydroxymuconate Delta-isomerase [Virgibacillus kapii]GGJ73656.1 5-carboxymethyl-2-hydroxymuconate isomerase [Virgibacillus kapii]
MPHLIIEYTNNLKEEADIPKLLRTVNNTLLEHQDIIPIGGLRSRAIELSDYLVADGTKDDAFVHVTLKLGKGRSEEEKQDLCDNLFKAIEQHFSIIYQNRYLALSMELYEFTSPTYKRNNIHPRYKE